jgi:hypothetical protein
MYILIKVCAYSKITIKNFDLQLVEFFLLKKLQ